MLQQLKRSKRPVKVISWFAKAPCSLWTGLCTLCCATSGSYAFVEAAEFGYGTLEHGTCFQIFSVSHVKPSFVNWTKDSFSLFWSWLRIWSRACERIPLFLLCLPPRTNPTIYGRYLCSSLHLPGRRQRKSSLGQMFSLSIRLLHTKVMVVVRMK